MAIIDKNAILPRQAVNRLSNAIKHAIADYELEIERIKTYTPDCLNPISEQALWEIQNDLKEIQDKMYFFYVRK